VSAKNSCNLQTYCDARLVADLVLEFNKQGIPHKGSFSFLLQAILRQAHKDWGAAHFESTEQALEFLSSEGFSIKQFKGGRQGLRALRAMQREEEAQPEREPPTWEREQEIAGLLEGM
jgi:hypothetical protein